MRRIPKPATASSARFACAPPRPRAEFDRIKVIYDEEYKQASVKLEALKKKKVADEAKDIEPELLDKYKAIKAALHAADHADSRRPLRRLQHAAPGGGYEQNPHRRGVCGM